MKKVNFLAFLLSIFLLIPTAANAAYSKADAFFLDGFKSSVIPNLYVFVSDSVSSEFSGYVETAKKEWSGIANSNIKFWSAGSATNADIRVYTGSFGLDYAGLATPYINGKPVTTEKVQTWDFVRININLGYFEANSISAPMQRKTVIHEFGHALSLKHQPKGTSSIMVNGNTSFTVPQTLDKDNIAWKY